MSSLDLGAWIVFATGPDSRAKDAARATVRLYASFMPAEQLGRNGVDSASLIEIIAAVAVGRVDRPFELTPPGLADKLSASGTPQECVAKISAEVASAGVNRLILVVHRRCQRNGRALLLQREASCDRVCAGLSRAFLHRRGASAGDGRVELCDAVHRALLREEAHRSA